jgi:hypothetical protein
MLVQHNILSRRPTEAGELSDGRREEREEEVIHCRLITDLWPRKVW